MSGTRTVKRTGLPPPMLLSMKAGTRLPSLKVFVCGGASVPPSLIREAKAHFERAAVTRVYGSTEVPVTTVGATRHDEADAAASRHAARGDRRH